MLLKPGLVLVTQRRAVDATCADIAHHLHHQQLSMLFTDLSLSHELLLLHDRLIAHLLSLLAVLILLFILIILVIKVSISPGHLDNLLFLVASTLGFLLFLLITSCLRLGLLTSDRGWCCIRF
jgi:hypothetical protein